jgi:hypothetical protein
MAIIEKIKKFVKDITPPSGEQKAKIEEKQMKVEEMKDSEAYRKNKAMYDTSTEVKKFDDNYKHGGKRARYLQLLNVLMVVLSVVKLKEKSANESLSWYG